MNSKYESKYTVATTQAAGCALRPHGFTVVEVIVTLAVGAILLALAVPALSGYIRSVRAVSETNDFVGALNRARSEALVRVGNMKLCASDTTATTPVCGGVWNDGWILFNDCDDDGTPDTATATCDTDGDGTAETNESLIRVGKPMDGGDGITGSTNTIVYLSNGALQSGAPQTFDVCVYGKDTGSQIGVNAIGRIMTTEVAC